MVELLAILFLILVAITPFVTLYLFGKYRKLREDFDSARTAQSSEFSNLRGEIAELKKQLASVISASPAPTAPGEKQVDRPGPTTPAPAKPVSVLPPRIDFPRAEQVPPLVAQPPQKAPAPRSPIEPPGLPAAAKTPADVKPAVPAVPQKVPPPGAPVASVLAARPPASATPPAQVGTPQPPASRMPPAQPHPGEAMPSTLAARISTPLPVSAFRVSAPKESAPKDSAPKPTLQQRLKTVSSIEETLCTNWLYKL